MTWNLCFYRNSRVDMNQSPAVHWVELCSPCCRLLPQTKLWPQVGFQSYQVNLVLVDSVVARSWWFEGSLIAESELTSWPCLDSGLTSASPTTSRSWPFASGFGAWRGRGGVRNEDSWGRRWTWLKTLGFLFRCSDESVLPLIFDLQSLDCHTRHSPLWFFSFSVVFSCSIILYSLICTFFIWFPSSFRVIFYLQSLRYLFFQLFTALYFGPHSLFILSCYEFKFLFFARGRVCPQTLSLFINASIPSHSSSLRLSIPLCSLPDPPAASLLSSCAVIQGGSGTPSWQQRWDGGMGWRQLSDYVCLFHWGLIWLSLILGVRTTRDVCVGVWQKVISASATMLWWEQQWQ